MAADAADAADAAAAAGLAGPAGEAVRPPSFFISYSPTDVRWASWIAWELEDAGYHTVLQAWDFVPGTNFMEFMDRGVTEAHVVIAVMSHHYLKSRWGMLEWQTAMRGNPKDPKGRLITVRTDDAPLDGFLAVVTFVDLAGVLDADEAHRRLLDGVAESVAGRAKPAVRPPYPLEKAPAAAAVGVAVDRPERRRPRIPPAFPPTQPTRRRPAGSVTVLHLPGPRFGRTDAAGLRDRIWGRLAAIERAGGPAPDLVVIAGDLTESGTRRQFDAALDFVSDLRAMLSLETRRILLVPGRHDVSHAASEAYFATCRADDNEPRRPYWPKWRHYSRMVAEFYQEVDGALFDPAQPWHLLPVPDLAVVLAGINTTIAQSHRDEDDHGLVGAEQAASLERHLALFEDDNWLRIGVAHHALAAPSVSRTDTIRDTQLLREKLGPRLNLLITGRGDTAPGLAPVVVTPPAREGLQLLEIRQDGLRSWREGADGKQTEAWRAHRWVSVGAAFSAARPGTTGHGDPGPADPSGAIAGGDDPRTVAAPDPAEELLEQVAEVCRVSNERARIRRVDGEAPHLVVTRPGDGVTPVVRIGAHVGELTHTDLERFADRVRALDPDGETELICSVPPSPGLRLEAKRWGIRLRSFLEFQGLLDLREFVARQSADIAADRRYPPSLYVPQRFREMVGATRTVREGLSEELMRLVAEEEGRFVLVLGDFGRGKTFALREVARRIPAELPHLTPIFIELRALDKAHSMDGLVAAHLANHGQSLADLQAFRYMLREGRIVLLFDGFDELASRVTYERATEHLATIIEATEGNAKVIVASRTHHFRTDEQVLTGLGHRVGLLPRRRVLTIEDFGSSQIHDYLRNRYRDEATADTRMRLINGIRDLIGLSRNPRMLSFIADLPAERLTRVAGAHDTISAASLYREILDSWLAFEINRTHGVAGSPPGLGLTDMWTAVTTLALRLWTTEEQLLRLSDLREVAQTLAGMTEERPSPAQTEHALGAGSLLVRTEDGLFGFIHSSVAEWLVANEIATAVSSGGGARTSTVAVATAVALALAGVAEPLGHRQLSALTVEFLCDLADPKALRSWASSVLDNPASDETSRANAVKINVRMRTPVRGDLRGASMRGEDLSHRELRGVDLTGADLAETRLIGADLTGATLRGATLAGACLDGAKLRGADLREADLTGARLLGADLRDVRFAGSRWPRALVINAGAAPELVARARASGAAVMPGGKVEIGLAPPAVSVNFGFETGRLPTPVSYSPDGSIMVIAGEDGGALVCDTDGRPLRTLQGHTGRVYAVAQNDDHIVTVSIDRVIRLWDSRAGEPLGDLRGHQDWIWPVALSPDGVLLVNGDRGGSVRVWDMAAREIRHTLPGHGERVWSAAFHPTARLLAIGDDTGTVRLWNPYDGRLVKVLGGHAGSVFRLAFAADGSELATADGQGDIRRWDSATGRLRQVLRGHENAVYTLDYRSDGAELASGDTRGVVRVWDLRTGEGRVVVRHTGAVYRVAYSPDDTILSSGDSDGVVQLTSTATDIRLHTLGGHRGSVWPQVFRGDSQRLVTASNDGTARIWETRTGTCRTTVTGHGRRNTMVRFSSDGRLVAVCGNDGLVRVWDPRTGRRLGQLGGISDRVVSALFSPVDHRITASSSAGSAHVWNLQPVAEALGELDESSTEPAGGADQSGGLGADDVDASDVGAFEIGVYEREVRVGTEHVWAEAYDSDGDVLATANDDDSVQLWYRTTGRHLLTLADHNGRVRSLAFSPDRRILASGCDDRLVRLWPVEAKVPSRPEDWKAGPPLILEGHTDRVYAVRFSPDGCHLASASNDGTARIWDVASGTCLHVLGDGTARLWAAAFSPDGSFLATAGDDLLIRLWDPRSGRQIAALAGHTRRIWSIDVSPDGRLLVSCGDDGTARLWDVSRQAEATRAPTVTLVGLDSGWAAIAPDGRYKFAGDVAGQVWHVIGMSRFELGELDGHLGDVRRLALGELF
ncbi:TIR domain-containing protein [Frankia sp. Cpl3]|uniref:TIR domain-containing protein n=1 Tax=Parafrankia colletiae TaxID=573497 RepID=UPI000A047AB0|nr:TIR domain-containing protein [Parafrankia colletiae]MCK9902780.1 TIR domain-containing protein [Frankia sp. Cpl3]